jgi:CheY-like chemotaxis protein
MKQAVDSPKILLLEDRPKQRMAFQLNLSIYLDAEVIQITSSAELKEALASNERPQLLIVRANFQEPGVLRTAEELASQATPAIPVICLGAPAESKSAAIKVSDTEIKPMLQAAARILGISAKKMVAKERTEMYQVEAEFLNVLFRFPCDVFEQAGKEFKTLFPKGNTVPRDTVQKLAKKKRYVWIPSIERLKLANAVTDQLVRAMRDLADPSLPFNQQAAVLSAALEMTASQLQKGGMDAESVQLAVAAVNAMQRVADGTTKVAELVRQILDSCSAYRYLHCQLIIFLSFHALKNMGWWGEPLRSTLAQAAFYHDILLQTDDLAISANEESYQKIAEKNPKTGDLLFNHAKLAAEELEKTPGITKEVVRVVLEHHGSTNGQGFSTQHDKLDNLSKVFIVAEEWTHFLLEENRENSPVSNDAFIAKAKAKYSDPITQQIVETFRYLNPSLLTVEILNQEEFASLGVRAGELQKEFSAKISGGKDEEKDVRIAAGAVKSEMTVVKNTTDRIGDASMTVVRGLAEKDGSGAEIVKGTKESQSDMIVVKGDGRDVVDQSVTAIKGDAEDQDKEKDLKVKSLSGGTELMRLALMGKLDRVKEILVGDEEVKVELRKTDAEGRTVIHYAAMGGSVPVLEFLLTKGASLTNTDSKRRSPLFLAALYHRNEAFDFLLSKGSKIKQQAIGGLTLAMVGAFTGNMHILQKAVEYGVRLNAAYQSGKTALDMAKEENRTEVVAYLEAAMKKKGPTRAA